MFLEGGLCCYRISFFLLFFCWSDGRNGRKIPSLIEDDKLNLYFSFDRKYCHLCKCKKSLNLKQKPKHYNSIK